MNNEETNRSYKPSLALYRPPNARPKLSSKNSQQHYQQPSNKMPIKSALKRSKSFASTDYGQGINKLNDIELSAEHQTLIRRALDNPNSLVMTQLMEIVRVICSKAMEKSINSHELAKICITIADKDKNQLFLEALINCCREWFNERDKLIKSSSSNSSSLSTNHPKHRWTAYVAFVTELYLNLKSKHRRVKLMIADDILNSLPEENSQEADETSIEHSNLITKQSRSLSMLLFDCCQAILISLNSSNSTAIDIECLLTVLRSVGRFMEEDNIQRMDKTVCLIREAFIGSLASKLSTMSLKSLLEVIEYRASSWQFNQTQQIYYFPYTKSDLV